MICPKTYVFAGDSNLVSLYCSAVSERYVLVILKIDNVSLLRTFHRHVTCDIQVSYTNKRHQTIIYHPVC